MSECYGEYKSTTMTAVRRSVWKGKIGSANNHCFCAKASVTTPTGESFLLNAKPSHFQACIWRSARESRPPLLDQLEHGWIWDTVSTILTPVMWPAGVPSAPDCSCNDSNEHLNSRRGLMLLCKCQIHIMIRKMTNKQCYVNILMILCVIAISPNQQC